MTSAAQMESWGIWEGDLEYSLEVVQHPLRARMCGFGDKDRRPLAPAAVAKMLVRRRDNTFVDADDIDIAFFLVTVDLWSEGGTEEMNLVLHPSAGGHPTNTYSGRRIKRPATSAYNAPPPGHYDSQPSAPVPGPPGYPPRQEGPYPPRGPEESAGYPQRPDATYNAPRPEGAAYAGRPDDSHTQTQYGGYEDPRGNWPPHYPPPAGPSNGGTAPPGPTGDHSQYQTLPPIGSIMASPSPNPQHAPHPHSHPHPHQRPYPPPPPPSQWSYGSQNPGYIDPALQQPHMQPPHGQPPPAPTAGPAYPEDGVYPSNPPGPPYYVQTPAALHGASAQHEPLPGTMQTTNLAYFSCFKICHTRLGLGTFRLRMRLMNVGAHPAPNAHATHVTTTSAPILAQTFTDPFTVYSAKRFPGVPETTPLSVAFGTQGQKLPLRNRNPGTSGKKGGRKNRGHGSESEGESEGGDSDDSPGTG
ncbi:unnamed protein product [Rhizoctonia solani]|uniref:Velvet domain-containing protein n=1 Tax=Rhizoctonia solani TaxID=456999 RepID=A0A8H2WEF9_9AGAM|nr:unnamed protein product [Rhizoctonia solani]